MTDLADYEPTELSVPLIVLFGAGRYGRLAHYALSRLGFQVDYFCDSDPEKAGTVLLGTYVLHEHELASLKNPRVFISCNYFLPVVHTVSKMGHKLLHDCVKLFDVVDFSGYDLSPGEVRVLIERHRAASGIVSAANEDKLIIRGMDIMTTETCSMKCKDCSNLMQYYEAPAHSMPEVQLPAFDRLSAAVDQFLEVRLIGGEPFMNKRINEYIAEMSANPKVGKIAIFTNATIVPKGAVLESLKDPKVYLDITNYGTELSRNHDKLIQTLNSHNIAYSTHPPQRWTDSGRIVKRDLTEEQLDEQFARCCVNDVLTLLHGKLYRCPFSANAMNLGAVPRVAEDLIDLTAEVPTNEIRQAVRNFYLMRRHISTCAYCNGRDFSTPTVEAALQAAKAIPYERIS